jgi:Ca2+-dependent lipid-binding protein
MIVPEEELPPMSEVERMARREPPSQFTQPEHKLYVHRPPSALLVMVCRARDLIMCDYNWLTRTGSSDPTVKLQVEGRDEVEQTSTQYKTLTPEWDEDFLLPCDDPEETLRITVEDYDRFSGNDFMGCVRIPLSALKHRQLVVNTYRLTDTKGRTKKNRGTIDLQLRWVHSPEHAVVIDHKYDEKEAFPGREANAVRILLIRGRKLPAMDRRLFGKEGTSDPMVTFRLKDKQLESTVKNKQLSPEWLEAFELRADDPDDSIVEVTVDDWDQLSGNDCMGKCYIDVKELKNRKLHRRWYALLPPNSKKPDQADESDVSEYSSEGEYGAEFMDHANKAPLGKLELACRWLYLPDFDLPVPDQMLRDTYPHDKINALHIYLVRGTHLPAVDTDITGNRTSDPLVTFVLEEERKNSKVKKRTLEPFWKEYFDVSVEGDLEPQVLKIVCDDWDLVIVQCREWRFTRLTINNAGRRQRLHGPVRRTVNKTAGSTVTSGLVLAHGWR